MAQSLSAKRLRKELLALTRDPVENITARPLEANILVWHYVLKGAYACVCVDATTPRLINGRTGRPINQSSFLPRLHPD